MATRSRLSKRLEQQTKKTLFFTTFGTVVFLYLLAKLGIPALANLSLFIAGGRAEETISKKNTELFVAPPILDPMPSATNSAALSLSGRAEKDQTINLYVNGELTDKTGVLDDKSFSFEDVTLSQGENSIRVKAITKNQQESDYSSEIKILFGNKAPTLTVASPEDGKSYSKDENTAHVSGKTDPGVKVTVNGFWAISDTTGEFSYSLPLSSGENKIKIIATDEAGNKTELERNVTFSP